MTVRLVELEPRWITLRDGNHARAGMTFLCPHCRRVRLGMWFSEPYYTLDFPVTEWPLYMLTHPDVKYWTRSGDDFETMTLTPSVNVHGHWHGNIANGAVTP